MFRDCPKCFKWARCVDFSREELVVRNCTSCGTAMKLVHMSPEEVGMSKGDEIPLPEVAATVKW